MADSESTAPRLLTRGQRRMVGFSLGLFALVASIALLAGVIVVLSLLLGIFAGVLWPLAVAGIMALIMRPLVEVVELRLRLQRLSAVIVLYGVFVLLVGGVLFVIVPPLVEQILDFIAFLPTFWVRAMHYIEINYPSWIALAQRQLENETVKRIVTGMVVEARQLAEQALPTLKSAGVGALNIFAFITHLAVVPIYLFFFLLSSREPGRDLGRHLPFLKPDVRADVVFLVREFIAIVVSFFRGQLLIGLIMGALLAIGFSIVGLKFGLFIGLGLGVLNIVPYLGTILGLSIALPLAFFQPGGGVPEVGLVLGVFCLVQMIEGWFLTPKIMGHRTGLHPVMIIVAIFFWGTALNGILGMVLAIPLTAFFVTAWRLVKHKYFKVETPPETTPTP
ncbi:MAG: AI-2E family transporter [Verrucomicrobia bacterium]|nr:AI-2E family transporter [Verrucomicrobiota bacterium]